MQIERDLNLIWIDQWGIIVDVALLVHFHGTWKDQGRYLPLFGVPLRDNHCPEIVCKGETIPPGIKLLLLMEAAK